ncbi:hypothetical protein NIES4102_38810 [Chondrocystis sp. NIES-4102]|nr:hypothetical protein NIES4102_12350 [Chondrocystis sp. NIES-4102]BAZ45132.1 hypothetical protein NIES4102_21500 [Chondrocystis sp. NIES-4102]BAZ46841.1 hypothetical protein NIES4102_38810 [Chondrocystis sp. NIES-4102]
MIKPNIQSSNKQLLVVENCSSNTTLSLHNTLSLTTNSFNYLLPTKTYSQFKFLKNFIHLDYLRLSSNNLTKKSFDSLVDFVFDKQETKTINKPWHPDPKMPQSKKYQNIITSSSGITLGYTKKAKNRGKNIRHVYDIMLDLSGAYFAKLSLLKQQKVISYLNINWTFKCHRIDVAIDDYSHKLIPVIEMKKAFKLGYNFGFSVIDDSYFKITDNQFEGTLAIGSRRSSLFIRIYTKGKDFVRYEAELKRQKAQGLFNQIANLEVDKTLANDLIVSFAIVLAEAALSSIDFRNKDNISSQKNMTKKRTDRLFFWQDFIDKVLVTIDNQLLDNN